MGYNSSADTAPGPGRWPTTLQRQTGFLSERTFYNVQCVIAGTYIVYTGIILGSLLFLAVSNT